MNKKLSHLISWIICACMTSMVLAQAPSSDIVKVPLTDPSRAATVKVNLLAGGITVRGYAGKEVLVEASARDDKKSPGEISPKAAGMKRIPNLATGLNIEEEDNVVSIGAGPTSRPVDLKIQVPARSILRLKTINDGDILVEQVQGEIEVSDLNGAVTLNQVSGSVVAHALNGNVKVSLTSVDANKSMSFSSLNGDIDVTLPADVKASAVMKTDNGEIYSDFDVKLDASATKPTVESSTGKAGKFRVKADRTVKGSINGGGPEMQFKTFNGDIFIRKPSK